VILITTLRAQCVAQWKTMGLVIEVSFTIESSDRWPKTKSVLNLTRSFKKADEVSNP